MTVRLAALVTLLALLPPAPSAATSEPFESPLPPWVTSWIESEGRHVWRLALNTGDRVALTVEQRQVDVVVTLEGPDGEALLSVDRPTGPVGTERLSAVARGPGEHRLVIAAWPTAGNGPWGGGVYRLFLEPLRPASGADRRRAEAVEIFARAETLAWDGEVRVAEPLYHQALGAFRELGDDFGRAEALDRLAQGVAEPDRKLQLLVRAEEAYRRAGDPVGAALATAQRGQILVREQRFEQAVGLLSILVPRLTALGDYRTVAHAWQNLGLAHRSLDQPQRALDAYRRSLALWQALDSPADEAITRQSLGTLLLVLGHHASARRQLEQARHLARSQGDRRGESLALLQLGRLHREEGRPREAFEVFRHAFWLGLGDPSLEAPALTGLGVLLYRHGRRSGSRALARDFHQRALTLNREAGESRNEIRSLLHLGNLALADGEPGAPDANEHGRRALELSRRLGEPSSEARARLLLGRTARFQEDLQTALVHARAAVSLWEEIRDRPLDPTLRAGWFADAQGSFDLLVDVLVDFHLQHPEDGWDERAFDAAERGRGRSLLDLLAQPAPPPTARLRAHQAEARRGINRAAAALREAVRQGGEEASLDRAEATLRSRLDTLSRLLEDERRSAPRTSGEPVPLAELRQRLLKPGTLLLVFRPGQERSVAWAAGADRLDLHVLPPGDPLQATARRAHQLLAAGPRRESRPATDRALCHLSRTLLEPLARRLEERSLLIVADGALQRLPVAALPDPRATTCDGAPPLATRHAVTRLPSASALVALRRQPPTPRPGSGIAVLADPVFETDDPRLPTPRVTAQTGGSEPGDPATARLERLPHTRREAAAILGLAKSSGNANALGFRAVKDWVLSGGLGPFRVVHFATHGVLHPVDPALSGLVLSRWTEAGEPRDGFLRSHEIRSLELSADLVVLSACRTALGREVAGEGILGLPRAFLDAGARAVLVSLWPVADDATASLMEHFYRHLLVEGRSPAEALHRAQAAMSRHERWSHPYYWAGFVLVGDGGSSPPVTD